MKPENWISIGQALLTLCGMFVASKLAVSASIRQFRSQKWWERQADIYGRVMENLAIIKHSVKGELDYELHPEYMTGPNRVLADQVANASAEVNKIASMGAYYLSEIASKAVDKCTSTLSISTGGGPVDELQIQLRSVEECLRVVRGEGEKARRARVSLLWGE